MATLLQDIESYADWITKAFAEDKLKLDYTIHSFIEIDRFFNKHAKDGKAVRGGRLTQNAGTIVFSLGAYVGQTIIKNVPGAVWITDDTDPEGEITASVKLPDGSMIFPIQRVMNRFQNGLEDAIYVYGHHIAKEFIDEPFDQTFWNISSEKNSKPQKPWWKLW